MKYLTEDYDIIMTAVLFLGFALAIGILVGIRKAAIKEEFDKEMASKARKVRKLD